MSLTAPWLEISKRFFISSLRGEEDLSAENQLVSRAKTEPEAFGQLYEIHYSAVLNYIFHRTLNRSVAEELTSDTFFQALRALPKYKPRAPFRAWLLRIASNEVRMYFRKTKRRGALEQTYFRQEETGRVCYPSFEWENRLDEEKALERFVAVHQALLNLPDRYQQVITLRYFENLSCQDIADVLGKRIGTVKSLIHRGLQKLRKILVQQNATFF